MPLRRSVPLQPVIFGIIGVSEKFANFGARTFCKRLPVDQGLLDFVKFPWAEEAGAQQSDADAISCRGFVPTADQSRTRTFQGSVMCSRGDSRSSKLSSAVRRPTAGSLPAPTGNPSLKRAARPRHASMLRATLP